LAYYHDCCEALHADPAVGLGLGRIDEAPELIERRRVSSGI
jgi:hypothetical protein